MSIRDDFFFLNIKNLTWSITIINQHVLYSHSSAYIKMLNNIQCIMQTILIGYFVGFTCSNLFCIIYSTEKTYVSVDMDGRLVGLLQHSPDRR